MRKETVGIVIIKAMIVLFVVNWLMGCVKKINSWPPSIEFYEGVDVHVGANGIDNVNDARGIGLREAKKTPGMAD